MLDLGEDLLDARQDLEDLLTADVFETDFGAFLYQ